MRDSALLMNSNYDKMICWDILYLLNTSHGTIESRRGIASTSVDDISMWIEVAILSFVRATLKLGDLSTLGKIQPTALSRYLCSSGVLELQNSITYADMLNADSKEAFHEPLSSTPGILKSSIYYSIKSIEFLCQDLKLVSGVSIKEREQSRIKEELQGQDMVVKHVIIFLSV
ncbi:hypothetical protein I7I51_08243 [Histoplasma capsulatum]|uniref:Uncharacterized protein n=1 Tax=Ajellomyces capsulatus TaxID=5037 RepID=A0A8A1M2B8_AJECA|nr:hypothetical protein I7I51_08243 [Histoplasma capsulatum]